MLYFHHWSCQLIYKLLVSWILKSQNQLDENKLNKQITGEKQTTPINSHIKNWWWYRHESANRTHREREREGRRIEVYAVDQYQKFCNQSKHFIVTFCCFPSSFFIVSCPFPSFYFYCRFHFLGALITHRQDLMNFLNSHLRCVLFLSTSALQIIKYI